MSGMYNLVFGSNPFMIIIRVLLAPREFGRIRDAWVEKLPDGSLRFAIYTRNGGNNRSEFMPDFTGDPLFIEDRDDDFDSTYATLYFRIPEDAQEKLREMGAPADFTLDQVAAPPVDMSQRWQEAIAALEDATPRAEHEND